MSKFNALLAVASLAALTFSGCKCMSFCSPNPEKAEEIVFTYSATPITLDGKADEKVWQETPAFPLLLSDESAEKNDGINAPKFSGNVRFAYDDKNLYLFADVADDDVVQFAEDNFGHFYTSGDLIEFFLMNKKTGHYWEIYGTPNAKYSVMFFPNAGRRIFPQAIDTKAEMAVAAQLFGSLNDYSDRDRGYTVEMTIPLEELAKKGDALKDGDWTCMAARYNYSAYLDEPELTTTSGLPKSNFHFREGYLPVVFKK